MLVITQSGRILYISENAAEYLGHSMVSFQWIQNNPQSISVFTNILTDSVKNDFLLYAQVRNVEFQQQKIPYLIHF